MKQNTFCNGKNRFQIAWDAFINPNSNNKFNEAIYKLIGGTTNTYNATLETLLTKGYGENPDVNAIVNQMASKTTIVPYYIKEIDDENSLKS